MRRGRTDALSLAAFVSEASDAVTALCQRQAQEHSLTVPTQTRAAELVRTRALGGGMQRDDVGLGAALHVPTGTRPGEFTELRHT